MDKKTRLLTICMFLSLFVVFEFVFTIKYLPENLGIIQLFLIFDYLILICIVIYGFSNSRVWTKNVLYLFFITSLINAFMFINFTFVISLIEIVSSIASLLMLFSISKELEKSLVKKSIIKAINKARLLEKELGLEKELIVEPYGVQEKKTKQKREIEIKSNGKNKDEKDKEKEKKANGKTTKKITESSKANLKEDKTKINETSTSKSRTKKKQDELKEKKSKTKSQVKSSSSKKNKKSKKRNTSKKSKSNKE